MKSSNYSVVIIGSGIAGLYAALKIEQQVNLPKGILIVTKSALGESNSCYAQGGIVGVLKENKKDSVESHISDTLKAGAGLSEFDTIKFISENSDKVIKDLLNFGVNFDKNENGEFTYTLEAAHSVNRVLHSGGDATGRKIQEALTKSVRENKNINIYTNTIAVDLLVDNECKGIIVFNDLTKEYETIYASAVILATGGIGQLYKYTTNPTGATGDGIALAYKAGAIMQDLEFVQFHPTALAISGSANRFLISEAVRGEGAKLVNSDGSQFMYKYDERLELAPRDVVTRAIFNEMKQNSTDKVYLDATCIDKDKLARRFPTISSVCMKYGIDIAKDYIPVAPAAHYYMGGVKTNVQGQTSINGLYAIGEVASTGLHGANRLASNSLLECVVCAYAVADYLKSTDLNNSNKSHDILLEEDASLINEKTFVNTDTTNNIDVKEFKSKLQNIMWNGAGILREDNILQNALSEIDKLYEEFSKVKVFLNKEEYEFDNMLLIAKLIVNSALLRKESRGAHCRLDYPKLSDEYKHSIISKNIGEYNFVK